MSRGVWNSWLRSDSFLNSLLFQFKSFSGIREPFTSIASFIPNDPECFLLTVHFLKYWFMSNLVQIKSTRNIFGIKKSLKKYLTSICCIMYTSFQDSMDESGSRPNFGFGMNFESFILKLRNWSLVFQKEGK